MQFERAEFAEGAPQSVVCSACEQDVVQAYYEIGGRIICNHCREKREQMQEGLGLGRFLRATIFGLAVGLAGAAVWWGVRAWTNYELGIISIFLGIGVGKAVWIGSREKGGWLYQLLAVFITYASVAANYTPDLVQQMIAENTDLPMAIMVPIAFILGFIVPFADPAANIIGILIIAFGLWEAWKLNKRVDALVTGPYTVTPGSTPMPAPLPTNG